jgi:hypothetical protein
MIWSKFVLFSLWYSWKTDQSHHCLSGPSWSWPYGSWIYNNISNQCISPLTLQVRIPLMRGVLHTTLCDNLRQVGGFFLVFRFPPPIKLNENKMSHQKWGFFRSPTFQHIPYGGVSARFHSHWCAPTTTEEPTRQNRTLASTVSMS